MASATPATASPDSCCQDRARCGLRRDGTSSTPILPLRHRDKEGNRIDEREAGLADSAATHTEYGEPAHNPFPQLAPPVLRKLADELKLTASQVAAGAGVSSSTVKRARAGKVTGDTARAKTVRAKLTDHAIRHARSHLRAAGIRPPTDHEALLATYLNPQNAPTSEALCPHLCPCGCGEPIRADQGRGSPRKYIDETHRKRVQRPGRRTP